MTLDEHLEEYKRDGYTVFRGYLSAEKVKAWDSFFSYCGRYEVRGDQVVHHIEGSLYPNWIGEAQTRMMRLDGDRLTLGTLPQKTRRGVQTTEVVWRRAAR